MNDATPDPTDAERRAAVCAALASAPGLLRFAARFSRCLEDAEDAYQRTMEIALTKAPVVEHERFMAWLRTVLRNEALANAARHRRDGPAAGEDAAEAAARVPDDHADVHALTEWRHRYHALNDALARISPAQRTCLILQAAGADYDTITQLTGFTRRKVERSILEGRAALTAWEARALSGETCERMRAGISRVAAGSADGKERRAVSRHVRHCGPCRALLRDRRSSSEWLAALAPVALLAGTSQAAPPDPGPALMWFERLGAGANVRVGSAMQVALELPGSIAAKIGAAAAAAVVAGSAGIPVVADVARGTGDDRRTAEAAVTVARSAPPTVPSPTPATTTSAAPVAARPEPAPAKPARAHDAPSPTRRVRVPTAPDLRRVVVIATRPPQRPADARAAPSGAEPRTATPAKTARTRTPTPTPRATPAPDPDVAGPAAISIGPGTP